MTVDRGSGGVSVCTYVCVCVCVRVRSSLTGEGEVLRSGGRWRGRSALRLTDSMSLGTVCRGLAPFQVVWVRCPMPLCLAGCPQHCSGCAVPSAASLGGGGQQGGGIREAHFISARRPAFIKVHSSRRQWRERDGEREREGRERKRGREAPRPALVRNPRSTDSYRDPPPPSPCSIPRGGHSD